MASQPIRDQTDLSFGENLFGFERGHSIIAAAVKAGMRGIADETNEPTA